ncbi:MAG: ATP-binding protein [Candidatus Latescibacterota bacterium]
MGEQNTPEAEADRGAGSGGAPAPPEGLAACMGAALFAAMPIPATLVDRDGNIVDVNPAFIRHAWSVGGRRLHRQDRVGMHFLDPITRAAERAQVAAFLEGLLRGGEEQRLRLEYGDGGTKTRVWELHGVVVSDEAGQPAGAVILREEITRTVSLERQQRAIGRVREAIWRMTSPDDLEEILVAVRAALQESSAALNDCGVNLVDTSVQPPTVRSHNMTHDGRWLVSTEPWGAQVLLRLWQEGCPRYRPDLEAQDELGEKERLQEMFGHPVRSVVDVPFAQGTLAANCEEPNAFSAEDLSYLQQLAMLLEEGFRRVEDLRSLARAQEEVQQAHKLEAVGRLAGGMAHDFNNLLTVIKGYSHLLLRQLGAGEDSGRAEIEEIDRAAEHGAGLVRQLLAFSRRQVLHPKVLDTNAVVGGLERMLQRLVGEDVEVLLQLAPAAGSVLADEGQLQQVLMNLAANARDAMPEGGRLTMRTANVEIRAALARAQGTPLAPGPYVLLAVSDTGVGMDAQTQALIFEPFYTTKTQGRGTGLGLATVYGIVSQSNGAITVESAPHRGTTFSIYLPRVAGQTAPGGTSAAAAPRALRGSETVLVVEDQPELRRLVVLTLRTEGYRVLEAADGRQAVLAARRHREPIHLLLTDLVMPGLNGRQLAETLPALQPDIRVLFMSGHAEGIIDRHGVLEMGASLLRKPFTPQEMLAQVRQVLEA